MSPDTARVDPRAVHILLASCTRCHEGSMRVHRARRGSIPRASGARARVVRLLYMIRSSFIRLVYTRKDDVKRAGAWAPLSLVSLARPSRGERGSGCEAHASQTLSSHRRVSGLANETTSYFFERAGCM